METESGTYRLYKVINQLTFGNGLSQVECEEIAEVISRARLDIEVEILGLRYNLEVAVRRLRKHGESIDELISDLNRPI